MKQKIVLKVEMRCQKCRSTALMVATAIDGVNSVAFEGEKKEKVVVVGDGVDAVKLTRKLRRKVGITEIVTLTEMKS